MKFHPCHCSAVSGVYSSTRHSACNKPKRDRICDTYMLLVSVVCNKWSIFVSIWFQLDRTYMPPLPPRHLLPHVLQIMPRNPKYDQFQSKGQHNEENPQSMTKVPKFDPFHEVKIVPIKKNQQTVTIIYSVLKMLTIHQHAKYQAISSMRSPGNAWKPQILPISLSHNSAKIRIITRPWP